MGELQNDGNDGITEDDNAAGVTFDEGSELATDIAEEQEKDTGADRDTEQESVQQAINKQHRKFRDEERKRILAEEQARKLEERLAAIEASSNVREIPPIPDPYDMDFEQKIAQREEALLQKARDESRKEAQKSQLDAKSEAAKRDEAQRVSKLVDVFDKRVSSLGLSRDEIGRAVDVVADYGISSAVGEFLLADEDGPLITKYLAANPLVLDDLRYMSDVSAALKIDREIRKAASSMKPQVSRAPDPAETLSGRGAGENDSPLIRGATFT
jgi:DNA primase catalytic subunit